MRTQVKVASEQLMYGSDDRGQNNTEINCNNTLITPQVQEKSFNTADRQSQIAARKAQMPKSYRANYDKAVKGNSLRSAVNAFCLECVCWQIKEVRNCTDLACPNWAVRPYQSSQNSCDEGFSGVELKMLAQRTAKG